MIEIHLKPYGPGRQAPIDEMVSSLRRSELLADAQDLRETRGSQVRGLPVVTEVIVALGSVGAFTAFYRTIGDFLRANRDRSFELVRKDRDTTIRITGHSLPEEKELLRMLIPEFAVSEDVSNNTKVMGHADNHGQQPSQ